MIYCKIGKNDGDSNLTFIPVQNLPGFYLPEKRTEALMCLCENIVAFSLSYSGNDAYYVGLMGPS